MHIVTQYNITLIYPHTSWCVCAFYYMLCPSLSAVSMSIDSSFFFLPQQHCIIFHPTITSLQLTPPARQLSHQHITQTSSYGHSCRISVTPFAYNKDTHTSAHTTRDCPLPLLWTIISGVSAAGPVISILKTAGISYPSRKLTVGVFPLGVHVLEFSNIWEQI